MNKYLKDFLIRGLIFSGFGPIIVGIVFLSLHYSLPDFSLSGTEVFFAIISTYLLAFVQAGASVFNQIEEWSLPRSLLCHFGMLYVAYVLCYLVNRWIPFSFIVILVFTAIFTVAYFAVWLTVYLVVKNLGKKMNRKL